MFKVKRRKTDQLFTRFMRLLFDYTCQRCGRKYEKAEKVRNLDVSHYWGRGRENTRFDEENCALLCHLPCHNLWGHGDGRNEYTEYMVKRLGSEGFDRLTLRANTYKKRDDKMDELILTEKIKLLEKK